MTDEFWAIDRCQFEDSSPRLCWPSLPGRSEPRARFARHQVTHAYFHGDHGPKGRLHRSSSDPVGLSFEGVSLPRPYDKASFVKRRFDDVAYGKAVAHLILSLRPDLVISGNTPTEAQSTIVKVSRKSGASFVFWVQDFYSIAVSKLLRKKMGAVGAAIGGYYRFLERGQFASSDAIVVITDSFADVAKNWVSCEDKIFTIENWGALNEITPHPKHNDWAQRHGLADTFNFLYSGTLALKHNPQLLVDLAKEVKGRANVVVVSQGVGVTDLERAKQEHSIDNLILLPLQPFADLPKVLATSDVTVATIEPDAGMFSVPSKVQSYFCAQRPVCWRRQPKILPPRWSARTELVLWSIRPTRQVSCAPRFSSWRMMPCAPGQRKVVGNLL